MASALEELHRLLRTRYFRINPTRCNIGEIDPARDRRLQRPLLLHPVLSNSVRLGKGTRHDQRVLALVQAMLPGTTEITCNKKVTCLPHRDRGNTSQSYIAFFDGDTPFEGGALVFEDGTRYETKGVWHGPFDGAQLLHWNEADTGDKLSCVTYSRCK